MGYDDWLNANNPEDRVRTCPKCDDVLDEDPESGCEACQWWPPEPNWEDMYASMIANERSRRFGRWI